MGMPPSNVKEGLAPLCRFPDGDLSMNPQSILYADVGFVNAFLGWMAESC
jgi:hypothetical protein